MHEITINITKCYSDTSQRIRKPSTGTEVNGLHSCLPSDQDRIVVVSDAAVRRCAAAIHIDARLPLAEAAQRSISVMINLQVRLKQKSAACL